MFSPPKLKPREYRVVSDQKYCVSSNLKHAQTHKIAERTLFSMRRPLRIFEIQKLGFVPHMGI